MLAFPGGFPWSFQRFTKGKAWQLEMMVKLITLNITTFSKKLGCCWGSLKAAIIIGNVAISLIYNLKIFSFKSTGLGWIKNRVTIPQAQKIVKETHTYEFSMFAWTSQQEKKQTSQNLFHHTFWMIGNLGYLSTSRRFPFKKKPDLNPLHQPPPYLNQHQVTIHLD